MDIRKLQRAIVDGLEDVKAQNIAVFNTEHLSSMFERVIIASGTSNRQTKALASSVRESVKARGMQVLSTEGEDNGEWIVVDCGAAVAHIMQPAIRDYYQLEEIWGGKAVKMKLGAAKTGLVKASEPDDSAGALKTPARKRAAAGKTAVKTAAKTPGKTPVKTATGKPARQVAVAAKTPARKRAPRAPLQTIVVGQPAARKSARKAAAPAAKKAARPAARKTAR